MFCKNCGANIAPGQSFCPSCGSPINQPNNNFNNQGFDNNIYSNQQFNQPVYSSSQQTTSGGSIIALLGGVAGLVSLILPGLSNYSESVTLFSFLSDVMEYISLANSYSSYYIDEVILGFLYIYIICIIGIVLSSIVAIVGGALKSKAMSITGGIFMLIASGLLFYIINSEFLVNVGIGVYVALASAIMMIIGGAMSQ